MTPATIPSLLYISTSLLDDHSQQQECDAIVSCALSRNADLNVTGALVFTGENFAQFLEGPQDALDDLMISIKKDKRHCDIKLVAVEQVAVRRFADWSLAYAGTSMFVARQIKQLLAPKNELPRSSQIIQLMQAFSNNDSHRLQSRA